MLNLHSLPSQKNTKRKRVGRGNASKGNYSGRGMKGQRSRSGGKSGLKLRGLKQSFLAIPKSRGFTSGRPAPQEVQVSTLERAFESGSEVSAAVLAEKGLISDSYAAVKVIGKDKLTKKLTVQLQAASKNAQEAITAAGGTFEQVPVAKRPAPAKKEAATDNTDEQQQPEQTAPQTPKKPEEPAN